MACNITRGRLIDCKDTIGGLKAIFIAKSYSNNVSAVATINTTEMTTAGFATWSCCGGTVEVFKYDLVFTQALSVTLQKIDHDMTNELRLMAYSRSQIFVQDANDNVFLLGIDNGCYVTGGSVITGTAKGDLNGYTIEWGAEENNALIQLPASAGAATAKFPFDGLSDEANLTITSGT